MRAQDNGKWEEAFVHRLFLKLQFRMAGFPEYVNYQEPIAKKKDSKTDALTSHFTMHDGNLLLNLGSNSCGNCDNNNLDPGILDTRTILFHTNEEDAATRLARLDNQMGPPSVKVPLTTARPLL